MEDLKGAKPKDKEEVAQALSKETEKTTPPKVEPTVGKIPTEEEIQARIDTGVGKGLASINQQLSAQRAAAEAAKAETAQHKAQVDALNEEIKVLNEEQDKFLAQETDADTRKSYNDRVAMSKERIAIAKTKAEAEHKLWTAEQLALATKLATRANTLVRDTGIPMLELEGCQTEEQMEIKALRFQVEQKGKPEEKKEPEEENPQFDAGVSTGGASKTYKSEEILKTLDHSTMTPQQIHEQVLELERAEREGRIK